MLRERGGDGHQGVESREGMEELRAGTHGKGERVATMFLVALVEAGAFGPGEQERQRRRRRKGHLEEQLSKSRSQLVAVKRGCHGQTGGRARREADGTGTSETGEGKEKEGGTQEGPR